MMQASSQKTTVLKKVVFEEWREVWKVAKARRKGRARGEGENKPKRGKAIKAKLLRHPSVWKMKEDDPAISKARMMTMGMDDPIVFSTLKHAMALEQMGSMEGAARLYATAIGSGLSANSVNVEILANYGRVLKHLRDFTAARHCYEKVLESDPKNFATLNNLAILNVHEGKNEEALEMFHKALKINPAHRETISNLARFQHNTIGNVKLAEQLYFKAVLLQPKSVQAITDLAEFEISARGEWYIARRLLQKVVRMDAKYTRGKSLLDSTEGRPAEVVSEAGRELEQKLLQIAELNWADHVRRKKIHVMSSNDQVNSAIAYALCSMLSWKRSKQVAS